MGPRTSWDAVAKRKKHPIITTGGKRSLVSVSRDLVVANGPQTVDTLPWYMNTGRSRL